ncbi:Vacuolar iron transporter family protein [Heracleum sosnowskyi]|uniref:Vacuolar iron transporter family protein n=1 Tax=Heracleum sosnowskyi TaxID=360622 RepID=A0AAD8M6W2_9APIA|nr:Vacuolar iron transporter family protein [Heracleum sosnowskyi]
MNEQGKQEPSLAPMPVLPRLDRLDRLLHLLEEKHGTSGRHITSSVISHTEKEEDSHSKPLSFALEEVGQKGTLMDRLAILENRVLQLSLVMDERNSSRSSSSTTGHIVSDAQNVAGQEKGETASSLEKQDSLQNQEIESGERKKKRSRSRKLRGWFRLGC